MRRAEITTTSYSLLGLLCLRPAWPAYELVQQSQRVLGLLWPRAESKVYAAAKRLVELGLAEAHQDPVGLRPRTVYSITPAGRQAVRGWLAKPGAGPVLEFEGALKVFFADQADLSQALATLDEIDGWVTRMQQIGSAIGREFVETDGGPFPERLHINSLINEFLLRHTAMVDEWARWARHQLDDWNGTGPQPHRHEHDLDSYRKGAARSRGAARRHGKSFATPNDPASTAPTP